MNNVESTIYTQYASSPNLNALISAFNQAVDIETFSDDFVAKLWDISTAEGYGLDVWGKIVGVTRYLNVLQETTAFGFDEAFISTDTESPKPFDEAPFYDGTRSTTTVRLADDAFRKLIYAKAMANITDCSIPSLNSALNYLFGDGGDCFVSITGVMSINYVFGFDLDDVEWAILLNSDSVAVPAGVSLGIMSLDFNNTFGFAEAELAPFDSGTFFPDSGLQNANQLTA